MVVVGVVVVCVCGGGSDGGSREVAVLAGGGGEGDGGGVGRWLCWQVVMVMVVVAAGRWLCWQVVMVVVAVAVLAGGGEHKFSTLYMRIVPAPVVMTPMRPMQCGGGTLVDCCRPLPSPLGHPMSH